MGDTQRPLILTKLSEEGYMTPLTVRGGGAGHRRIDYPTQAMVAWSG